jgi:uncharacterized membrane protein
VSERRKATNLGPVQRRRRLVIGATGLLAGVVLVGALIGLGASPGWLLLAFAPFFVGALGVIQARERT